MFGKPQPIKLFQVDAFASEPFSGNPAAVVVLTKMKDEAWMQKVAQEMNLSATAFVAPHEDPFKRAWRLRWFTPSAELPLCGHGTLSAAYILWTEGYLRPDLPAVFDTNAGKLSATYELGTWITLDFPTILTETVEPPAGLFDALGIESAVAVARNERYVIVEVDSAETVRTLTPNHAALARLNMRGAIVTTRHDDGQHDIISRYFAPAVGIPEDPVTGSAHCCLAPYWATKLNKTKLLAHQASARSGSLKLALNGDRVKISGKAAIVFRGELV